MVKLMKKIISIVSLFLLITGCGNASKEEFYLNYKDKNLYLDNEFTKENYGEYNDSFESENCAFGDKDITYIYDDVEVEAYGNSKGEMIVYSIVLTGDNIATNEGIKLYDSVSDMIKKYGNDYEKNENQYLYKKGNTEIVFITQNDIIETIEYRLVKVD